jgi:hypothetical protein
VIRVKALLIVCWEKSFRGDFTCQRDENVWICHKFLAGKRALGEILHAKEPMTCRFAIIFQMEKEL